MNNTGIWIHVYPVSDMSEHDLKSPFCKCNPEIDMDNFIIVHASLDRLEVFEQKESEGE